METPLVSIIIPTFNRAHLIGETLDSIVAQTYKNWECIIVDDGSTDNTVEVINKYIEKDTRFQYHHRPSDRPKGGNAARNYGFEVSKGEYVNWFDSDDIMLSNFIQKKITHFHYGMDFNFCAYTLVDENLKFLKDVSLIDTNNLYKDYALWKLQIVTLSVLFKKEFLKGKKLFSYNIKRGQETELFLRLFFNSNKEAYKIINEPLFLYRQHKGSKTHKNKVYKKEYKESVALIYIDNLRKSFLLRDKDLISFYYKNLIVIWFEALAKKDNKNRLLIGRELNKIIRDVSIKKYVILTLLLKFCELTNNPSERIKYFLKKITFDNLKNNSI
ncbi:glycosyltransferase [Bizionia gelidisalsuginis]|uniref:Glycosyltransferase n=1 Tax=Bizionia gelidisalsuginis TaxID=291188 RepID=A0ABY3MDI2_9FLAO|nr:glycosyltransferase [Bizionia gelidisalsuginis]TYC17015.1 glycosyltransferase [Bizionia gelidisalsuginis]